MNIPTVGIIGAGFVGQAVYNTFRYVTDVKVFDIAKEIDSFLEVAEQDVIFVCVPTPRGPDGGCDVSVVESTLKKLNAVYEDGVKPVIIKSTIPGDYLPLTRDFRNLEVIFSPEFLTERMANRDFAMQHRVILGIDEGQFLSTHVVHRLFQLGMPGVEVVVTSWEYASLLKYILNCFFAVKVSFFNEVNQVVQEAGLDYDALIDLVSGDGRIARHHLTVPGPDGKLGFGGQCLPKDLDEFISRAQRMGIDPKVMIAAREKNREVR